MSPTDFKELRKKLGLNQEKMAELIGLSYDTVQSIEQGRREISIGNAALIEKRTKGVLSTLDAAKKAQEEYGSKVSELEGIGYGKALPEGNNDQMMLMIMANNTTSSVSLELLCEVLSKVSGQKLTQVKARAKALAQEKAQKLSAVMDAMI